MSEVRLERVTANDVDFAYLTIGSGPLALCLHGFPDTAYTWRHLLPALAEAGYTAVAPFQRGYAPTEVPRDARYQTGALVADAVALHEALGGDADAVLVGHDWGAMAAYGAASLAPERWRRLVTAAVPPPPNADNPFGDYDAVQRMAYIFFFQSPLADLVVPVDDFAYLRRLWEVWSPGYDPTEDMVHVREALARPENVAAALGYYRALFDPLGGDPELAAAQDATGTAPTVPNLYVHGRDDGCVPAPAAPAMPSGSRAAVLVDAGHFVHVEQPRAFNDLVLDFLGG